MFKYHDVYKVEISFKCDGREHLIKGVAFKYEGVRYGVRNWKSECGRFVVSSNRYFDETGSANGINRPFIGGGRSCTDFQTAANAEAKSQYARYYEAKRFADEFETKSNFAKGRLND